MFISKRVDLFYQVGVFFFLSFMFFSAIFCGQTRVNNLFHISALILIGCFFAYRPLRQSFCSNRKSLLGLFLTLLFLLYYSFSAIWGQHPGDITSELTHSGYLLLYLTWLIILLDSTRRMQLLWVMLAGITLLCLYLSVTEYSSIYHLRQTTRSNPGPHNVIDLAGYAAIGIFLSLMIFRDTKRKAVLITIPPLLVFMILTQSRGPAIAVAVSLIVTTPYLRLSKRNLLGLAGMVLIIAILFVYSAAGEMFIDRFGELYQQSFVRLSIWHHSLLLIGQTPFFGYGIEKELNFLNYTGELNHTTHSLYLGALLKGGLVGFSLLMVLLIYGAKLGLQHMNVGRRLEAALYLFMTIFYCSQGMFVIANPAEFWYLFWLPLGIVLSQPDRRSINT